MSCHPLSATLVSSSRGHALATSAPFNFEMVMIIEFESVVDHENLGTALGLAFVVLSVRID